MSGETPIILLLGFIWIILQLKRSKLPHRNERHDQANRFLDYIVTWILVITFILSYSKPPLSYYLTTLTSVAIGAVVFWAYFGDKISSRPSNLKVHGLLRNTNVMIVLSCGMEVFSLFGLYLDSYFLGEYNFVSSLAKLADYTVTLSPSSAYMGIIVNSLGVTVASYTLALASYRRGLFRAIKSIQ